VGVFVGPTAKAASLNRGRLITAPIPFDNASPTVG